MQANCYQGLWIVKPAKLSRGRGIRVFTTLQEAHILDRTHAKLACAHMFMCAAAGIYWRQEGGDNAT